MSNLKNYYLEQTREQKQGLQDLETSVVYFRLMLKVTSETTVTPKGQKLEAGQCVTGLRTLADECRITTRQVRTILRNLENLELIKVDSRSIGSIVTILSYRTAKATTRKINTTKDIETRKREFIATVMPFKEKYGSNMCNAFYKYWTEKTPNGKKMNFETKRTWEVGLRLATWSNNNFNNEPKTTQADDHLKNHIMNQLKNKK